MLLERPRNPKRFNEARALSAGSWSGGFGSRVRLFSFNEARALSAGSCTSARENRAQRSSFNEARALSAGSCGERNMTEYLKLASMRPAH